VRIGRTSGQPPTPEVTPRVGLMLVGGMPTGILSTSTTQFFRKTVLMVSRRGQVAGIWRLMRSMRENYWGRVCE
jgi:hypothetical protein